MGRGVITSANTFEDLRHKLQLIGGCVCSTKMRRVAYGGGGAKGLQGRHS
jgi:hypothetical protein